MKKIIAILLASVIILTLAGCGDGSSSSGGSTTAGTTAAPETTEQAQAESNSEETTSTAEEKSEETTVSAGESDPSWQDVTFINAILGIRLNSKIPEGEWEYSSPYKYPSDGIVYKAAQQAGGEEVSVSVSMKTSEKGWQLDTFLKEENNRNAIKGEGYEGTWYEWNDRSLIYELVMGDWPYDDNYGVVVKYEFPISYNSDEAEALGEELKSALLAAPVIEEYDNGIAGLTDGTGILRFADTIVYDGNEISLECKPGTLGGVLTEYEDSDGVTYKLSNYSTSSKSAFDYQKENIDYNVTEYGGYEATESVKEGKYVEVIVDFNDEVYVDFKCEFTDGGSEDTAKGLIEALVEGVTEVAGFDEEWITSGLF